LRSLSPQNVDFIYRSKPNEAAGEMYRRLRNLLSKTEDIVSGHDKLSGIHETAGKVLSRAIYTYKMRHAMRDFISMTTALKTNLEDVSCSLLKSSASRNNTVHTVTRILLDNLQHFFCTLTGDTNVVAVLKIFEEPDSEFLKCIHSSNATAERIHAEPRLKAV
jgi:hypothetical protein